MSLPEFCQSVMLPDKSREETQSKSKSSFSLLSCDRLFKVISARVRRINDVPNPLTVTVITHKHAIYILSATRLKILFGDRNRSISETALRERPHSAGQYFRSRLCDGFTRRVCVEADYLAAEPSCFCLDSVPLA